MYQIHIESVDFEGKRLVAQHRLVTQVKQKNSLALENDKNREMGMGG